MTTLPNADSARGHVVVLDVGKTLSKISLWTGAGDLVARRIRNNRCVQGPGYLALDSDGIEDWLTDSLAEFSRTARIEAIMPVAHGAAVAVVRGGRLHAPPMDYENPIPSTERDRYDRQRDAFARTGSPALPNGLNVGAQLHLLDVLDPSALSAGATLLLWPQYWAWRLSGVAAAELTSLGCHTDLWCPAEAVPSALAIRRGWVDLLPPLRRAADCLGTLTPEWSRKTGLPADVRVHCGIHDSNAALLAGRAFAEIAGREATVLSTGTWFVAMRSVAEGVVVDIAGLPEARDCLVNVDAYGKPVPSARFMGGREIEVLTGTHSRRVDIKTDQPALIGAVPSVLASGARVLPTFASGFGPYPKRGGEWRNMPANDTTHRAAVCLYAALVADSSLNLIGTRERILIEGRFAEADVFVRALASLRPGTDVYTAHAESDVSYGALRLVNPTLASSSALRVARPLDADISAYAQLWRKESDYLSATP